MGWTSDLRIREFESGKWFVGNAMGWNGPFNSEQEATAYIERHGGLVFIR